jgi:hypothetical protein
VTDQDGRTLALIVAEKERLMKPTSDLATRQTRSRLLLTLLVTVTASLIAGCGSAVQAPPTAQIVTVPVEVTRVVEVVNTVEVTRPVTVTVVVEVTPTAGVASTVPPQPTQAAPTVAALPTNTPVAYAFETPKAAGVSRLKVDNETDETLKIEISGPKYYAFELAQKKSAFLSVPFGNYTMLVTRGSGQSYTAKFSCVSPLKYEIDLRLSEAKVIPP